MTEPYFDENDFESQWREREEEARQAYTVEPPEREPGSDDEIDFDAMLDADELAAEQYYADTALEVRAAYGEELGGAGLGGILDYPLGTRWDKRRCAQWLREVFLVAPEGETKEDRAERLAEVRMRLYG